MFSICIELKTSCKYCKSPLMLNALTETFLCNACHKTNKFSFKNWQTLLDDGLKEGMKMEEGEGQNSTIMSGEYSYELLYGRLPARCNSCKERVNEDELESLSETRHHQCKSCNTDLFIRKAPPSVLKEFPEIKYLAMEDPGLLTDGTYKEEMPDDLKPVVFNCPACGGSLKVDGKDRLVPCTYCNSDVYLPDDLWLRLHPAKSVGRWYIILDNQFLTEKIQDWYSVHAVIADKGGNVYLATSDDDDDFMVWAIGPDMKTLWTRKDIQMDDNKCRMSLSHDQQIYLWDIENPSLLKLSAKDGSTIKKIQGQVNSDHNPEIFGMKECESIISDTDGSIIMIVNDKLARFTEDGQSIPLWEGKKANPVLGFLKKVIRSEEISDKELRAAGDYPKHLDGYYTRLFSGWDGMLYFTDFRHNKMFVAKYNRQGEQIMKVEFPIANWGKTACVDREGRIYVLANSQPDGHTHLMRSTPDGQHLETILNDLKEGGLLDDEEYLAVSPDGKIFIFETYNALKIFSPQLEMIYRSDQSKKDDEEVIKEMNRTNSKEKFN